MAEAKCHQCGKVLKVVTHTGYEDSEYEGLEIHSTPYDCIRYLAFKVRKLEEKYLG